MKVLYMIYEIPGTSFLIHIVQRRKQGFWRTYIYALDFSKIIKSNLMLTELSESNVNFDSYYEHNASTVIGMQLAGIICFAVK